MIQFGHALRERFMLHKDFIHINNGSYGTFPREVYEAKLNYQKQMNERPDYFFQFQAQKMLDQTRHKAAEFLGVKDSHHLLFTQNSTDACNSIFRSLTYKSGDKILLSNITYQANLKVFEYIRDRYGVELIQVELNKENIQTKEGILKAYEDILNKHVDIKITNIDHISSQPAIIFPIAEIIQLFRTKSPQTLIYIDGAHTAGQIKLDISQYDVDFYSTNFHKWAYAPRGACVLYFKKDHEKWLKPNLIGNYVDEGIHRAFYWQGTQDYTNYIAISDAIDFINSVGQDKIQEYCSNLAWTAAQEIVKIWNTDLLVNDRNVYANMVMIRIPEQDFELVKSIHDEMLRDYNVCAFPKNFDQTVYVRISAQIFNELSDFTRYANLFSELLAKKKTEK